MLRFKKGLQDPKGLLLLLCRSIVQNAIKFFLEDGGVNFLRFKFKKCRKRDVQSGGYGAYDFERWPFFASFNLPEIACRYPGFLGRQLSRYVGRFSDRTNFLPEKELVIHLVVVEPSYR